MKPRQSNFWKVFGLPTVILGPGETAMAHKTDEYCLVSKINEAVDLYTEIGQQWILA